MTEKFQEIMFSAFGEELKPSDIESFSMVPQDIHLANTVLQCYEFCWFRDGDKYKRATTYLLTVPPGETVRLFTLLNADDLNEEAVVKKELTNPDADGIRIYVIGKSVVEAKEFLKEVEGLAKENNGTEEES